MSSTSEETELVALMIETIGNSKNLTDRDKILCINLISNYWSESGTTKQKIGDKEC